MRKQIEATFHITQPLPANEAKSYGTFSAAPGVDADRVSFATDYYLRVPAIVYHPAGATITQHPALVIVNGHGGDKSSWYAHWAGILYARAGAVVLTYDPIGEYERNRERRSNTNQHDELIPPDDMARRLEGLMLTDILESVDYLGHRKDVDPKRIAVLGFSMGSFLSSIACAVDTHVHACVLAGGGDLDGPGGHWDSVSQKMCEAIPYQSLSFLGDRAAAIFALNAKRGPTLVINGANDDNVDIPHHSADFFEDLRKRTIAEAGGNKDVFDSAIIPNGGHRPYFLTKTAALWLEEKLKFPDWTKKQIEAMPETDKGGLLALGNDIPVANRDDLHAVPESVWDSQQDRYVYESWVDHAKAAITSGAP